MEVVVLTCYECGQESQHELTYVGRLLHSTRCRECGHLVRHEQRDLLLAYLHDLEHRVVSKPGRTWRRAASGPVSFVRGLPGALARQPRKLATEVWTLWRR